MHKTFGHDRTIYLQIIVRTIRNDLDVAHGPTSKSPKITNDVSDAIAFFVACSVNGMVNAEEELHVLYVLCNKIPLYRSI